MAKGRMWKAYFSYAVVLMCIGLAVAFVAWDELALEWWEWLYFPLGLLQMIGLFGFVYARRIARPLTWQVIFIATAGFELWNVLAMTQEFFAEPDVPQGLAAFAFVVYLTQIPLWWGIFAYAFRARDLWRETS